MYLWTILFSIYVSIIFFFLFIKLIHIFMNFLTLEAHAPQKSSSYPKDKSNCTPSSQSNTSHEKHVRTDRSLKSSNLHYHHLSYFIETPTNI